MIMTIAAILLSYYVWHSSYSLTELLQVRPFPENKLFRIVGVITDRMSFLLLNQQRPSTKGTATSL